MLLQTSHVDLSLRFELTIQSLLPTYFYGWGRKGVKLRPQVSEKFPLFQLVASIQLVKFMIIYPPPLTIDKTLNYVNIR